jgi:hypothetical protein
VFDVSPLIVSEPDAAFVPLHPPLATQLVAFVDVQFKIVVSGDIPEVGLAVNEVTIGETPPVTVTLPKVAALVQILLPGGGIL